MKIFGVSSKAADDGFDGTKHNLQEKVDNLHSRIKVLESNLEDSDFKLKETENLISVYDEENRKKDAIIQNISHPGFWILVITLGGSSGPTAIFWHFGVFLCPLVTLLNPI